jgi:ferric-dicitrate binding protein FerR (iron transport regulator)
MFSQPERITYLLKQYAAQKMSGEEEQELFNVIDDAEHEEAIKLALMQMLQNQSADNNFNEDEWNVVLKKILNTKKNTTAVHHKIKAFHWTRIAAAAILLIAVGLGVFFSSHNTQKNLAETNVKSAALKNDIAPGGNKAILTLGNGSRVILDSTMKATIIKQGETTISKPQNGDLVYSSDNVDKENEVIYNTLSTPMGAQYSLQLPDGSKAWLNAASSITFPTAFNGSNRNVSITGEVYFEVAKDKTKPFIVNVNDIQVEVLGTHFNINSYSDEDAIKTTLLEGSVKILKAGKTAMLAPGQQAVINNSDINLLNSVDIDQVIAWKEGNFYFKNDDMTEIAKQLSRWYNADIMIKKQTSKHYTGIISRSNNISAVLKMLELAGDVQFEIDGNNITVTEN